MLDQIPFSSMSTPSTSSDNNGKITNGILKESILMPHSIDDDFQSQLPNLLHSDDGEDFGSVLEKILKESMKSLSHTNNLLNRNSKLGKRKLVKILLTLKTFHFLNLKKKFSLEFGIWSSII